MTSILYLIEDNRTLLLILLLSVVLLSATGVLDWSRIGDTISSWFGSGSGGSSNNSNSNCYTNCGTRTCG